METIGYIYYSDGYREEVAHQTHGEYAAQSALITVERSTAQAFEFEQRHPSRFTGKAIRYDVQQFK